jgi:hypothetical protein
VGIWMTKSPPFAKSNKTLNYIAPMQQSHRRESDGRRKGNYTVGNTIVGKWTTRKRKSKVSSYSHGVGKVADMLKVIFSPLFSDNKDSYSILRRMGIHGDRLGEKAVSSSHRWLSVSVSHEMRGRPTVDLTEIIRYRRHWKVVGLSRSCETRKKHITAITGPLGGGTKEKGRQGGTLIATLGEI